MTRGTTQEVKVHYKGNGDDFIIYVTGEEAVQNYAKDKTIPLVDVVNGWKVFVTHK